MSHIFISYSHDDQDYVHKLQQALINQGFDVWIDDRIDYGSEWPKIIQDRLDECSAFLLVATENSYKSKWVQMEVARAQRINKPFFPLLLSGHPWLIIESTQYVDVRGGTLPTEKFYKGLEIVVPRRPVAIDSTPQSAPIPPTPKPLPRRTIGFSAMIVGILAISFWVLPKIFSPEGTATASLTSTLRPTASFTHRPPTNTPSPPQVSSASATPARTATASNSDSGSLKTSSLDGAKLVFVPGSGDVKSYWIDQSTVTTLMFEKFVNATAYITDAEKSRVGFVWTNLGEQPATQFPGQTGIVLEWRLISGVDWRNPPREEWMGDQVLQVSWNDALAYCKWAGRELLTLDEWTLAHASDLSINFDNDFGEWGADRTSGVYRVVLGREDVKWGGYTTYLFQEKGFVEYRSANRLTFRCKQK